MGFFATFNIWLNELLNRYIELNVVRIAEALEPVIVTLGVLYVLIWGSCRFSGESKSRLSRG